MTVKKDTPIPPPKNSAKRLAVRDSLPEELQPIYDQLVDEYMYYALMRTGKGWAAYEIIADLVKSGWRVQEKT